MRFIRIASFCWLLTAAGVISPCATAAWTRLTPTMLPYNASAIWGFSPDDVFIAYSAGDIAHWDGVSWEEQRTNTSDQEEVINALWGQASNDVWAVGYRHVPFYEALITHWNGYSWEDSELPFEAIIRDIWGFSSDNVLAVGWFSDGGYVMRYNGNEWSLQETGLSVSLSCVWGAAPDDVFAGVENGGIVHWNGVDWQEMDCDFSRPVDLWGFSGSDVYAACEASGVWHWDGAAWARMDGLGSWPINGIWGSAPDDLYAVLKDTSSLRAPMYHYDGTSWSKTSYQFLDLQLTDIWGFDGDHIFAAGEDGICLYWDGSGWRNLDDGVRSDLNAVKAVDENTVYAAGESGKVFKWDLDRIQLLGRFIPRDTCSFGQDSLLAVAGSRLIAWDGSEWNLLVDNSCSNFFFLGAVSENTAYLLDVYGGLFRWDGHTLKSFYHFGITGITDMWVAGPGCVYVAGGTDDHGFLLQGYDKTWETVEIPGLQPVKGIWGTGQDDIFIWSENRQVLHWDGQIWCEMDMGVDVDVNDIWGTSANNVFAVGSNGYIGHWNGQAWTVETCPVSNNLLSINGTGPDDILVAGILGTLVHWDGHSWSSVELGTDDHLETVTSTPNGDMFVFGVYGTALRRNGSAWQQVFYPTDETINDIWINGDGTLYTVGDYSSLMRFDGRQWQVISPEGTGYGNVLNSIWVSGDNHVFAVGSKIIHYDGEMMTEMPAPGERALTSVWGRNSDDVFAVSDSCTVHWDGSQWSIVSSLFRLNRIWGLDTGNVYGLSSVSNRMYQWDGAQWKMLVDFYSLDFQCTDLWGTSPENLFVVEATSTFVHWDGVEWTRTDKKTGYPLRRIHGCSDSILFAVGNNGTMLRFDDYQVALALHMPAALFHQGDLCWLTADVTNPNSMIENAMFFTVLDVYGEYFFYPSWCHYPDECEGIDYETFNFRTGTTHLTLIPEFTWPDVGYSTGNLAFHSAILDSRSGVLLSGVESWFFRY